MKRLEKGGVYYFISVPYFKVCQTRDEYFGTDDQRFQDGNYFPDANDAHECFDTIAETYGEKLEDIAEKIEKNKSSFVKTTTKLAVWARDGKRIEDGKEYDVTPENVCGSLVDAYKVYNKQLQQLSKKRLELHAKIKKTIKRAKK